MIRIFRKVFIAGYSSIILLFFCCALALIYFAVHELWDGVNPAREATQGVRFHSVLEGIGLLTIAIATFGLSQTILEEEIVREAHMSAPTRVRRFLSRFMVVIIVSLSVESLIAVFQFMHNNPSQLPQAASIGITAGVLLAAWGVFIKLNKSAEELEPEAMEQAKGEDQKVKE